MHKSTPHFLHHFSITPEALPFIAIPLALSCMLGLTAFFFQSKILYAGILFFFFIGAFVAYFFRDPDRDVTNLSEYDIVSPADGTITGIVTLDEPDFRKSTSIRVSIFLSLFNVHINRIPCSGIVQYTKYTRGKFHGAYLDKASLKNENMGLGIKGNDGSTVLVRQIAGFIARRIVCDAAVGDAVRAGSRYGLIKFGSRVDIYLPCDTKIHVKVGDKVFGGLTIIGCRNETKTQN